MCMENKPRPCNERDNGHVYLNIGGNIFKRRLFKMKISKANICPPFLARYLLTAGGQLPPLRTICPPAPPIPPQAFIQ